MGNLDTLGILESGNGLEKAVYFAPVFPPKTFKPDRLVVLPAQVLAPGFARNGVEPFPFETLPPMPHLENWGKTCDELDQSLKEFFSLLIVRLNAVHKVNFPPVFWKVPAYSWLIAYLHITYDFHARLKAAILLYGKENVTVLAPVEESNFIRSKIPAMQDYDDSDVASLYSMIASEMGMSVRRISYPRTQSVKKRFFSRLLALRFSDWGHQIFKKGRNLAYAPLLKLFEGKDVFIGEIGAAPAAKARFSRKLGVRWKLGENMLISGKAIDRNALKISGLTSEHEQIAGRLIPLFMPRYLAEEFESYLEAAKSWGKIKLFVPGTSWHRPIVAFAISWGRLHGARFAGWQHGGGYGQFASSSFEFIERDMADFFITWGWSDKRYQGGECLPLSQPYLNYGHNKHNGGERNILWGGTTSWAYMIRLNAYPGMPDNIPLYFKNKRDFAAALNPEIRHKIVHRSYPGPVVVWNEQENIMMREFPDIKVDISGNFLHRLTYARLLIFDHRGTSFLQALTANAPTILFWDGVLDKDREEAKEYFDLLRNAGILFHDPVAAAEQVNRVWDNVEDWWGRPGLQAALKKFVNRFCRSSDKWESEWMEALLKMMPERDSSKING